MKDTLKLLKEIINYFSKSRKWWLMPLALLIVIIGLVILLVNTSPIPVFIYPLV